MLSENQSSQEREMQKEFELYKKVNIPHTMRRHWNDTVGRYNYVIGLCSIENSKLNNVMPGYSQGLVPMKCEPNILFNFIIEDLSRRGYRCRYVPLGKTFVSEYMGEKDFTLKLFCSRITPRIKRGAFHIIRYDRNEKRWFYKANSKVAPIYCDEDSNVKLSEDGEPVLIEEKESNISYFPIAYINVYSSSNIEMFFRKIRVNMKKKFSIFLNKLSSGVYQRNIAKSLKYIYLCMKRWILHRKIKHENQNK